MLSQWFSPKIKKIGFEDIKTAVENPRSYLIINTMSFNEQDCLIKGTIAMEEEEKAVNSMLESYDTRTKIIILYGRNSTDDKIETKYRQLVGLGVTDVYVYYGGLFEWLLLQDIYGEPEFPTTGSRVGMDILRFRPSRVFT